MAVSIARKTLIHEWRRFLPAIVAVGFSGVLMIVQGALLLGIIGSNALYVTQSKAEYWVGFPGTQSVDLGRPIGADTATSLYIEQNISNIEPFLLGSGDWRGARGGGTGVTIVGIDTKANGLALGRIVPAMMRNLLLEPGTVLIDATDKSKLAIDVGGSAEINGRRVRVVGIIDGLRGLGGVNVITSIDTARTLDTALSTSDNVTYFLYNVNKFAPGDAILNRLNQQAGSKRFYVWSAQDLAGMSIRYWLLESGAGVAFIFATAIAMLVGTLVTSQTLMAAVAGSIPQYATLRALGVSFKSLRVIVIEQAAWVGVLGLLLGATFSIIAATIANMYRVPFELRTSVMLAASIVVLLVAFAAGLLALRRLHHADPATLLR
ncbi:ABC transporter permease [Phyllobacterium sp. OV277]|uniref:ABC transporter permease n=1 Tax=Phyllobacterium sp. OV277 TaxID=1882772 RepID=UPI00088F976B|nr:ABC transporter permease [Phyllobacterium sp. OV277]SDP70464.1 putative ABC transport system permease protein [Phyllobacterium sp. OV277]